MPIYEYKCQKCEETFEVLQGMHDSPLKKHSDIYPGKRRSLCDGDVERIPSTASFKFKGSGFYATDYPKSKT
jgi:predicted nucleic acid-binding Zn ribbon protein